MTVAEYIEREAMVTEMYEELVETLRETSDKRMHEAADAIEELEKDLERSKEYETFWNKEAEEALRRFQVAVANKPRWIPVEERLPEVFKHVLVNIPGMTPHPTVQEAFREKYGTWYSNGFRYGADEITHWMPLPEPPKEETE